jgi:hypothetical protein
MYKVPDRIGLRFGRLLITERGPSRSGTTDSFWWCLCDCGNIVLVRWRSLKGGATQSCGCYQKECAIRSQRATFLKHDLSKDALYGVMQGMKNRCYKTDDPHYSRWGGRGIYICDEWKENFLAFYEWAQQSGYKKGLSLDRIDNDGPYSPNNCRWATREEQMNNTRHNKYITFEGKTLSVTQWSKHLNVKAKILRQRLQRGWSDEEVITTPLGIKRISWKRLKQQPEGM